MTPLLLIMITSILASLFKEGDSQIINGFELEQRDFNYHVTIFRDGIVKCAGGMIDENHVVTAAHCLNAHEEDLLLVVAGVKYLNDGIRHAKAVENIAINTMISSEERCLNDIAVLKLQSPFVLGENIGVITLPISPISSADNLKKCSITGLQRIGLGRPYDRKVSWTKLTIIPTEMAECLSKRNLEASWLYATADDVSRMTSGDSGSVLVCNGVAEGILSGVVRLPNNFPGKVYAFTRIYDHLEFIRRRGNISNPCTIKSCRRKTCVIL